MNIAIGYAEGIVSTNLIFRMSFFHYHCFTFRYLHHQATPHIIHRDIKANNVYLDSDFQARIGGFRFAKLIPDGAIHVSTEVKGTLSYLAPEYAMLGKANEGCDVYSFGIAVKRLKVWSNRAETEFTVELEILARIRHKNLLSLRGYCAEGQERLIVYEYMQNLSLHSHLHGHHSFECLLDWNRRMNIAIGSAEGIVYLHHQATPHIIHRDIKASNVLLDSDFRARVADFGFAKLMPDGATHMTTKVKGTLGYLAPEYAMLGKANESCDVYSFGILLLELTSGKRPIEKLNSTVRRSIVDWALHLVCEKKFSEIADPRLNGNYVEGELKRVVLVALMCAQDLPEKRPTILDVIELLKGESKDKFYHIENSEMFRSLLAVESNDETSVAEDSLDYISEEKELQRPLKGNN
ncbi:PTI1-like tyrosine-protein kinase [Glycine soja]|nr:PTI1-like tyrosine-protein kinase [Glycine soja]